MDINTTEVADVVVDAADAVENTAVELVQVAEDVGQEAVDQAKQDLPFDL